MGIKRERLDSEATASGGGLRSLGRQRSGAAASPLVALGGRGVVPAYVPAHVRRCPELPPQREKNSSPDASAPPRPTPQPAQRRTLPHPAASTDWPVRAGTFRCGAARVGRRVETAAGRHPAMLRRSCGRKKEPCATAVAAKPRPSGCQRESVHQFELRCSRLRIASVGVAQAAGADFSSTRRVELLSAQFTDISIRQRARICFEVACFCAAAQTSANLEMPRI